MNDIRNFQKEEDESEAQHCVDERHVVREEYFCILLKKERCSPTSYIDIVCEKENIIGLN